MTKAMGIGTTQVGEAGEGIRGGSGDNSRSHWRASKTKALHYGRVKHKGLACDGSAGTIRHKNAVVPQSRAVLCEPREGVRSKLWSPRLRQFPGVGPLPGQ